MDKKEIQSIWDAFLEVQEAKKAPVTKKDDDGEGMDPVGKEDGDVDNDGDKDSSDEYLKNRRKKISKEIEKDKDVKESEESPYPSLDKKKREKKGSNLEDAGGPAAKLKGESVEEGKHEDEEGEKEECPKCKGEGCDHCDGKGYHMAKKEGYGKKMKESALFSDAELEAIEEKMKQPNDSGTKAEPFMSTNSAGEKKFYADHEKGSEKKYEDWEETSENDGEKAGRAVKSQSPARRGDNLKVGDNAMPTPTKAKGK